MYVIYIIRENTVKIYQEMLCGRNKLNSFLIELKYWQNYKRLCDLNPSERYDWNSNGLWYPNVILEKHSKRDKVSKLIFYKTHQNSAKTNNPNNLIMINFQWRLTVKTSDCLVFQITGSELLEFPWRKGIILTGSPHCCEKLTYLNRFRVAIYLCR